MKKPCSKGKGIQPVSALSPRATARSGRNSQCKTCVCAVMAKRRAAAVALRPARSCGNCGTLLTHYKHYCSELCQARAAAKRLRNAGLCYRCRQPALPGRAFCLFCSQKGTDRTRQVRTGCSPEQYTRLLREQGGVCAICHKPPSRRALAADHDHVTHQMRGALCWSCNSAIGKMYDSPELLRTAAVYLE